MEGTNGVVVTGSLGHEVVGVSGVGAPRHFWRWVGAEGVEAVRFG